MAKGIGRLIRVGIGKETSRGTPSSTGTPTYMVAWAEISVDEKADHILDDQTRGVIEASVGESIVKQWAEGQIKAPIGSKHFPLLLYSILGTKGVAGPTDSAYTHTLTVAQSSQHNSLTLFVDDPIGGQDYIHPLTVPSQVEINYERGQFLSYTADLMAQKGSPQSVNTVAVSETRFLPQHVVFKIASTQSGLTAASALPIKSARLTIRQNIEPDDVLGNIAPQDFLNKQFEIEGEIEAVWQNESDFKTAAVAGTVKALRFDMINTGAVIGVSTNPSIRIDLHSVHFQPITREIKVNDMVMQRISFRAHYNETDAKMVTITAVNDVSSY